MWGIRSPHEGPSGDVVPSRRPIRYENVLDLPDWGAQGEKAPLVRMLARKG